MVYILVFRRCGAVLISEVRKFKYEMRATPQQMEELAELCQRVRVNACDSRIDKLCERVDGLEGRVMGGAGIEPADGALLQTVNQLKADVNARDHELCSII